MHQSTPSSPPRGRAVRRPASGRASTARALRLIVLLTILALAAFGPARAQCVVENGSFELDTAARIQPPGYWITPSVETQIDGVPGWFTRFYSPDIFTPPTDVPCNFMTGTFCRSPFHGNNYMGVSNGVFGGLFHSEILAGNLLSSPTGAWYEVRARFAMAMGRPTASMVQVSLDNGMGTTPYIVGTMLVNNPNWNLFSQFINLPATPTYSRIVIQALNAITPGGPAYFFVDSVDICRSSPDPCSYLAAHAQYAPNPSGTGCCWNLFIDNTLPSWLSQVYFVRLTSVAPSTLSGPVTNGPGLSSVTTLPYTARWNRTAGGPFPTGTGQYIGTYCLNAGPPPQLQIIEFLGQNQQVLCRDSIWTDCQQEWHPCMDLAIGNILCGPLDAAGNRTYTFTMNMNVLNHIPGYVKFFSPQGTVTPNIVGVPSYTQAIPMTFTDIPPVDGHICIYAEHHVKINNRDSIICRDTACVDLPRCADDCCKNFQKAISQTKLSVTNGNVTLSGCVSAGPNQIKRFSATIIAAQTRTRCGTSVGAWTRIFGDITGGTLAASLGTPSLVPTMAFSREIIWGGPAFPYCVPFTPCKAFSLNMIFPNPPTAITCIDSLRFAVRYSFTDCNCVTCDTVVYYQVPRRYVPIIWGGGGTTTTTSAGTIDISPYVRPEPGLLNITMSTSEQGTLNVSMPQAQQGDPQIRIIGMTFRPIGVALRSLVEHGTQNGAWISGNIADISYTLDQGQSKEFDLSYLNGEGIESIENLMVFRYVVFGENGSDTDSVTSDTVLVYGTTPSGGGDVVETTQSNMQNVRTYALHMVASNNLGQAVNGLRLHVNGGATLIAVGPVGDGTDAQLSAGADHSGNTVVQVDKSTWTVENVDAGGTLDPIYLTFAGVGNNTVSVDYTTTSEDGSVMSTGTADISSPLRVAGVENEQGETSATLMPVYPNPTAHSATVQFDLKSAGHVSVSVRDVRGNEVLRLIDGQQLGVGEHLVPFDTNALPPGTYVVTMEVDGRMFTRPLTIVR